MSISMAMLMFSFRICFMTAGTKVTRLLTRVRTGLAPTGSADPQPTTNK